MTQNKIKRINILAKKAKDGTITDLEKKEQKALRKEYLADVKHNFRAQLDNIKFVDENDSK